MGKKGKRCYTLLSNVDHKNQYENILAVIKEITTTLNRSKSLSNITLDVVDSSDNSGFVIKLDLDREILCQFLNVAKRGLIVGFSDIKIIKNEGVVYGLVVDEEEVTLYSDKAKPLKWYCNEETCSVPDEVANAIKKLFIWRQINFSNDTSKESSCNGDEKDVPARKSNSRKTSPKSQSPLKKLRSKLNDSINSPSNSMLRNNSSQINKRSSLRRSETELKSFPTHSENERKQRSPVIPRNSDAQNKSNLRIVKKSSLISVDKDKDSDNSSSDTDKNKSAKLVQSTSKVINDIQNEDNLRTRSKVLLSDATSKTSPPSENKNTTNKLVNTKRNNNNEEATVKKIKISTENTFGNRPTNNDTIPKSKPKLVSYSFNNSSSNTSTDESQSDSDVNIISINKGRTDNRFTKNKGNKIQGKNNVSSRNNNRLQKPDLKRKKVEDNRLNVNKRRVIETRFKNIDNSKDDKRKSEAPEPLKPPLRSPKTNKDLAKKGNKDDVAYLLEPLTRKVYLKQVDLLADVSLCDLEEIEVPEKFDFHCKVISEFKLFEDLIQVIRVVDGSVCKKSTLIIPRCSSWGDVTQEISKNPIVKPKLPFVDIIIFGFPLTDYQIIPGKFYELRNIMAIKLSLKDDPRKKEDITRGELFFCVEGRNAHSKLANTNRRNEILEKCQADSFKKACQNLNSIEEILGMDKIDNLKNLLSSLYEDTKTTPHHSKDSQVVKNITPNKNKSPEKNTTQPEKVNTSVNKMNLSSSSDETLFGETPPQKKKTVETKQNDEVSLSLSPLTQTEDVHLKNTGSEVTFSQFIEGAKRKAVDFRTSTQIEELSEIVENKKRTNKKQSKQPVDVEVPVMESLVYVPSSPSNSLSGKDKPTALSESPEEPEELPESELHHKDKVLHNSPSETDGDNNSSIIISPHENEISSNNNSSDVEFVVIETCSKAKSSKTHKNENKLPSKSVDPSHSDNSALSTNNGNKNNISQESEQIEVSDQSSNDSFLSCERIVLSEKVGKPYDNSHLKNDQDCHIDHISEVKISNSSNLEEMLQRIPDSCFMKYTKSFSRLPEEVLNEIQGGNEIVNYVSYSHDRCLPFMSIAMVRKLVNENTLTITSRIVSITPSLKDSWRESCIKSLCSSCNRLYNTYNAVNHKYSENTESSALSVGGHIVCPESQCCNQILDKPAFHFSLDLQLPEGSTIKAFLETTHAENIFGCTAEEAARDETELSKVAAVLEKISDKISKLEPVKMDITRENICKPLSGQLYIKRLYL